MNNKNHSLLCPVKSTEKTVGGLCKSEDTNSTKLFKDYLGLGAGAIRINVLCLVSTCAEVRVMVEQLRKMKSYLRVSNCISIPNHKLQL